MNDYVLNNKNLADILGNDPIQTLVEQVEADFINTNGKTMVYHYTNSAVLDSIKENGLVPLFGLTWFTSDENGVYGGIPNLAYNIKLGMYLPDDFKNVAENLENDKDTLSGFMDTSLIHLVADVKAWYYTDKTIPFEELTVGYLEEEENE